MTLSVVFSCKKDPEIPYCELHPDDCVDIRMVKDWFYFDYGSWWVYEEENTGMRDSVYVTQTFSDTGSFEFSTRLFSSYDEYYYRLWANNAISDAEDNLVRKIDRSIVVKRSKGKEGDYIGESICFIFYPRQGYSEPSISGTGYPENEVYIDSAFFEKIVEGNTFSDVVKVGENHTVIEEYQGTIHYFASGVGLIRKELADSNQVWNLVSYSVTQNHK
jgi:hypothetical protein